MLLYFRFFALQLKSQMQYKLSFFLTTLGQFITSFAAFFGVYFMFSRFNEVENFTYEQALLCFAVVTMAFSLGEMAGGGFATFPRMLGNGEFDRVLIRPRSTLFQILAPKMDFTRIGLFAQAVLVLGYAVKTSGIIWSISKIITLCLMILSGSVIFFCLFLIYAGFSFFTVEGLQFFNLFTYGGRQFGRYPFSIYGKNVLMFLTFVIPLALFQYYPLLYLLDREQGILFMLMPLLGLFFLLPSYALFRFGLRHYKSTGS
jgi:ABC-2 type transport system permease protein